WTAAIARRSMPKRYSVCACWHVRASSAWCRGGGDDRDERVAAGSPVAAGLAVVAGYLRLAVDVRCAAGTGADALVAAAQRQRRRAARAVRGRAAAGAR